VDSRKIQKKLEKEAKLAAETIAISATVYLSAYITLLNKKASYAIDYALQPLPFSALTPKDKPDGDASLPPTAGHLRRNGHGDNDINWESFGTGLQSLTQGLSNLVALAELEIQNIINEDEENAAQARAEQFKADLAAAEDKKKHGPK